MIRKQRVRYLTLFCGMALLVLLAGCDLLWPLTAAIDASAVSGYAPLTVVFDSGSSTGGIVAREWNFGDPSSGTSNVSTQLRPSYTYDDDGTYTVTLRVFDDEGGMVQTTLTVTVLNPPPQAQLDANPLHGPAPLTVTFDLSSSVDPAGIIPGPGGQIVSYVLAFGDGTQPATGTDLGIPVQHTYAQAGQYIAMLTVIDDDGASSSTTRFITVEGAVASYATPGNDPVGLAFDGSFLWLSDWGTKRIYKIRLADGVVLASFEAPGEPMTPLSETSAPRAIIPAPSDPGTPGGLAWGNGALWVACLSDGKVYKINPYLPTTDPGHEMAVLENQMFKPLAVAFGGGYLWVSDLLSGNIYRVNPSTGFVVLAVDATRITPSSVSVNGIVLGGAATGLTWADGYLWAISGTSLHKIDPVSGTVIATLPVPGSTPQDLAYDGTFLWHVDSTGSGPGTLYRMIVP